MTPDRLSLHALPGIGEIMPHDDLATLLGDAIDRSAGEPETGDVLVIAQKIVSKAEDRYFTLAEVTPGPRARELAAVTHKDSRLVELILAESADVLRAVPGVLIVRHRLGLVLANAGIDQSNIVDGDARVLLLPVDPDGSAARIRARLAERYTAAPAIIISDSFGRAWRMGTVNVAIGAAGLASVIDRRGERDRFGRVLQATAIGHADAIAAAAGLIGGEAAEGTPAVLVRGLSHHAQECSAAALIRPVAQDLFI